MNVDREMEDVTDDEDLNELINMYVQPRQEKDFEIEQIILKNGIMNFCKDLGYLGIQLHRNHALSPSKKALATLRFLATGSTLQVVGDVSGFDKGMASRVIYQCIAAIARIRPTYIKMPRAEQGKNYIKWGLYRINRYPQCIGAINCTHVRIQSLGGPNAEIFRNRKDYFSYNIQVVSDSKLLFQDIVCRWHRSSHDSTIFNNSRLKQDFENGVYGSDSLLFGDSSYPVRRYLMTPLLQPRSPAEFLYESHIRTRNPFESFGIWKQRFPILSLV